MIKHFSVFLFCCLPFLLFGQQKFSIQIAAGLNVDVKEVLIQGYDVGLIVGNHTDNHFEFEKSKLKLDLYKLQVLDSEGNYISSNKLWFDGNSELILEPGDRGYKLSHTSEAGLALSQEIDTILGYFDQQKFALADSSIVKKLPTHIDDGFGKELIASYIQLNRNNPKKIGFLDSLMYQSFVIKRGLEYEKAIIDAYIDTIEFDFNQISLLKYGKDSLMFENLAELADKDVLLDWWHTGCPPCVADHNRIMNHLDEIRSKGYQWIGVSVDMGQERWKNYLTKKGVAWENYIITAQNAQGGDLLNMKLLNAFPTYQLVRNGKLIYSSNKLDELLDYLQTGE